MRSPRYSKWKERNSGNQHSGHCNIKVQWNEEELTIETEKYCNRKWGLAANCSKAIKEARLVERGISFILDASNQKEGGRLSKGQLPVTDSGQELLEAEGGGYIQKQNYQLTVTLKLVISGLTSVILTVLSTVNIQVQGQFVSISCIQFSEFQRLISWVQSGHDVVNFFHLGFQCL